MMTRCYIIMLSIALLVICLVQAVPTPAQDHTTTTNNIEDTFKKIADSISDGFKTMMENPNVEKIVKEGQQFFKNAAENFQSEASKFIPKTDETNAPAES